MLSANPSVWLVASACLTFVALKIKIEMVQPEKIAEKIVQPEKNSRKNSTA